MKLTFTVRVEVEDNTPGAVGLQRLKDKCHEAVSTTLCAYKHQRLAADAGKIATHVETTIA